MTQKLGSVEIVKNTSKSMEEGKEAIFVGFMVGYENRVRVSLPFFLLQTRPKSKERERFFLNQ